MKYTCIILCAAGLVSTAAMAGDDKSKKGSETVFESLDKDADGRLSQVEVTADSGLSSNFASLDSNSDGFITKKEFRANTMPKKKPGPVNPN